jgi:hypothetical protein
VQINDENIEEVKSFAGIPPEKFYREDIDESECVIAECERGPVMVNVDDIEDVVCKPHYREMTPPQRRGWILISNVPYRKPPMTIAEAIFNGADSDDEDYELTDEELDKALINENK